MSTLPALREWHLSLFQTPGRVGRSPGAHASTAVASMQASSPRIAADIGVPLSWPDAAVLDKVAAVLRTV